MERMDDAKLAERRDVEKHPMTLEKATTEVGGIM